MRSPLIPYAAIVLLIIAGLSWYRYDAAKDANREHEVVRLREGADADRQAREEIDRWAKMLADSVEASREQVAEERARADRYAQIAERLRRQADEAIEPNFEHSGTDSALAAQADEQLRSRLNGVDTLRAIRPLPYSRFDAPRPLLVDYVYLLTRTLPALQKERKATRVLLYQQETVIASQSKQIDLQDEQIASMHRSASLYAAEVAKWVEISDIQERRIRSLKWWRRGAQVLAISWGVREVLR